MCMICEPEVDGGALYLSYCTLSVSGMQAGVCITLTDNAQRYSMPSATSAYVGPEFEHAFQL